MNTTTAALSEHDQAERDALVGRLYASTIGALELFHVYLGDRLGLYQALATKGPLTAKGLASAAGINERYAREWLEQEAVAGILEVERDGHVHPGVGTACPAATPRSCWTLTAPISLPL